MDDECVNPGNFWKIIDQLISTPKEKAENPEKSR